MIFEPRDPGDASSWADYAGFNDGWTSQDFDPARIIASRDYRPNTETPSLAEHVAFPVPVQRKAKLGVKFRYPNPDPRESIVDVKHIPLKTVQAAIAPPGEDLTLVYDLTANDTNLTLQLSEVRSIFWVTSEIHGGDQLVHAARWFAKKATNDIPRAIGGHMWHGWLHAVAIHDNGLRKDPVVYLWGMRGDMRVCISFTTSGSCVTAAKQIIGRAADHRLAWEPGLSADARERLQSVCHSGGREAPIELVKKGTDVWQFPTKLDMYPASALMGLTTK